MIESLKEELRGLRRSREKVFQTPPMEWIEERLRGLKEVLERRTPQSALLLRELLGPIRLEPIRGDIGRPYYLARTSINTLALLKMPPRRGGSDDSSNSLRWWTRTQRIRTVAHVPLEVALVDTRVAPLYQRIAGRALQLRQLGLSNSAIARKLSVTDKTVAKAVGWISHLSRRPRR